MDMFERNGLSPDQIEFRGNGANLPVTLTRPNKSVVVVGFSRADSTISNYLHEEGYRVILARPDTALETIRWEQPALALVSGGLHGEGCFELLRRIKADQLTQGVKLIIWTLEPPAKAALANEQRVIFINNLDGLRSTLRRLSRPGFKSPALFSVTYHPKSNHLQNLLSNHRLRHFVDEVIESWPVMALAAFLGQETDAVVNVEMLCHQFDLTPEESAGAIGQLARHGYIEPLELEGYDPLFGVVATPEPLQLMIDFGEALKNPEYRMALATLILARERIAEC